jgi:hypothetical protein
VILSALPRNFHEGLLVSSLVGFLFFLFFSFFNLVLRVLYHREMCIVKLLEEVLNGIQWQASYLYFKLKS